MHKATNSYKQYSTTTSQTNLTQSNFSWKLRALWEAYFCLIMYPINAKNCLKGFKFLKDKPVKKKLNNSCYLTFLLLCVKEISDKIKYFFPVWVIQATLKLWVEFGKFLKCKNLSILNILSIIRTFILSLNASQR